MDLTEKEIKHHSSSSIPVEIEPSEEYKLKRQQLLNTFVAKNVGRGIWNMFMTLVFALRYNIPEKYTTYQCISLINYNFMRYCKEIYCLVCRNHAARYISNNKIVQRLRDIQNLEDPDKDNKLIFEYFNWLYNFRNSANSYANKAHPEFEDVLRFFNGEESGISHEDFCYAKIKDGIWHCIFLLATKSSQTDEIKATYFLIVNYFKYLPLKQKQIFDEAKLKYNFMQVLEDDNSDEANCIYFFEWIYIMYKLLNEEYETYEKELLEDVYYNMTFCSTSCGH